MRLTESDVKIIIRRTCEELGRLSPPTISLNVNDFKDIREKAERLVELTEQLELWQLRRSVE